MILGRLGHLAIHSTTIVALPLRLAFRTAHALVGYPTWLLRRLAFRLSRNQPLPVVGIHAVFIAKENILFLKEWILYHRYMGVEHFFLYDNSGGDGYFRGADIPLFERDRATKYGIRYEDIVALTDAEVADALDHIQREVPNVHVVPWRPTDAEGRVRYAQVEAMNDALRRFGPAVDWMVFMDMDEFLVPDQPIPEMARKLEAGGYDSGRICDRAMTSRFDLLDRYVTESTMTFRDPFWPACKLLCKVSRMWYVMVGRGVSLGREYDFSEEELFSLHYKFPSSHPEQRGHFEERDTGIPSEWLEELRATGGAYCGPEWKLGAANPEWKRIMEDNEWRPS